MGTLANEDDWLNASATRIHFRYQQEDRIIPAALGMEIPRGGGGNARICIMAKIFIDTNILIYCMDQFDPEKRQRCRALLNNIEK